MKAIDITYSDTFTPSPMTGWTSVPMAVWTQEKTKSGQWKKPELRTANAFRRYKKYALLTAHLDGIDMRFATPEELDHFCDVMARNPLPNSGSLVPGRTANGTPNNHWLSRFPSKGKTAKFREKAVAYLTGTAPALAEFRAFYADKQMDAPFAFAKDTPLTGTGAHNDPYRKMS